MNRDVSYDFEQSQGGATIALYSSTLVLTFEFKSVLKQRVTKTQMVENIKTAAIDINNTEENEEVKQPVERQEAFVVFSNEKDLRHHEAIRIKASLYTGIALRVKLISPAAMENLLYAIDIDSGLVARSK